MKQRRQQLSNTFETLSTQKNMQRRQVCCSFKPIDINQVEFKKLNSQGNIMEAGNAKLHQQKASYMG